MIYVVLENGAHVEREMSDEEAGALAASGATVLRPSVVAPMTLPKFDRNREVIAPDDPAPMVPKTWDP